MPALLSILPYMKKYRLHSLLTALLMIISAVACRDVNENALVTAENLMMEHPDSALSVLESIDGSCLTGELQARHALLLSQAYDKNLYRPHFRLTHFHRHRLLRKAWQRPPSPDGVFV